MGDFNVVQRRRTQRELLDLDVHKLWKKFEILQKQKYLSAKIYKANGISEKGSEQSELWSNRASSRGDAPPPTRGFSVPSTPNETRPAGARL
ncbi:hypothetical protein EVAR_43336_1 [Eumeta japonica]|uniref:Uncharacterized protein n=1 Tax=Eumeta variegata TaxID=151549 RepID=A0A4C1WQB0_EUMVA|nr:hypothetical protein EVAR_43336_1 [Eumeta japonica]